MYLSGSRDVYEIPTGSHSIRITNKGRSYLGIREKDGQNGFNQQTPTPLHQGQYSVAGVTVRYTRLRSGREHIDIDEPIQEPIIVTVSLNTLNIPREMQGVRQPSSTPHPHHMKSPLFVIN